MLLYPQWFHKTNPRGVYSLAILFALLQMIYVAVYLKTTLVNWRNTLSPTCTDEPSKKSIQQMERGLFETFIWYIGATSLFALARVYSIPALLATGLVVFNIAPLYLMRAQQARIRNFESRFFKNKNL